MNVKLLTRTAVVLGVALAAASVAACSSSNPSKGSGSTSAAGGTSNSVPENLTVALGSAGTYDAPVILADTMGYAKAQGLNLKLEVVGVNAFNIILAGQADLAQGGVGSPLPAIQSGKSTKIVYALESGVVSASVLATRSVSTFADCKSIATSPVGSNAYAATMAYIHAVGTKPKVTSLTATAALVPTLVNGQNDCAVNAGSSLVIPPGSGLHLIVDPNDASTMPDQSLLKATGAVLYGLNSDLTGKRSAIVKLMKAMNQAVNYMASASAPEIATSLTKSSLLSAFTVSQLTTLYKGDQPFLAPDKGLITAATWANNLKLYAYDFPYIANGSPMWSYSNVVDTSYLASAE